MKVPKLTKEVVFHLVLCFKFKKPKYLVDCCAQNTFFVSRQIDLLELVMDTTQGYNINKILEIMLFFFFFMSYSSNFHIFLTGIKQKIQPKMIITSHNPYKKSCKKYC